MTLPNATFYRVVHEMTGTSVPLGAAVVYCLDGPGTVLNATEADGIHDAFANAFTPTISNGVSIVKTIVKQGPDATGPQREHVEVDNGALSGAACSSNVSFLLHKRTALGGRRGRGRLYLPGVLEADIDAAGGLAAARITALTTAVSGWITALGLVGTGFLLALEHYPGISGEPATPTLVDQVVVDPQAATQRKRMRR